MDKIAQEKFIKSIAETCKNILQEDDFREFQFDLNDKIIEKKIVNQNSGQQTFVTTVPCCYS